MKKLVSFALFFCSLFPLLQAQMAEYSSYPMSVSYPIPRSMTRTSDGGLAIITNHGSDVYPVIMKLDAAGAPQWQKKLMYPDVSVLFDVTETTDHGIAILTSDSNGGIILIKLTSTGVISWTKRYNYSLSNQGFALTHNSDNGVLIVGNGCAGHNFGIYTDSLGGIIWAKQFKDLAYSSSNGNEVIQVSDDEFVVAGIEINSLPAVMHVMSITASGSLNWFKEYSFTFHVYPYNLVAAAGGGYTICAATDNYPYNSLIMHVDNTGGLVWDKKLDLPYTNAPYDIEQLDDGSYLMTGYVTYGGSTSMEVLLTSTDASGNLLWAFSDGAVASSGSDNMQSIEKAAGGAYDILGCTADGAVIWHMNSAAGLCSGLQETPTVTSPACNVTSPAITILDIAFAESDVTTTYLDLTASKNVLCSSPLGTATAQPSHNLTLYPNPAQESLSLSGDLLGQPVQVTVLDVNGKTVLQRDNYHSGARLDVSGLPAGMYLLQARTQDETQTAKLVITR